MLLPLQGVLLFGALFPQGVALGYVLLPLPGRAALDFVALWLCAYWSFSPYNCIL